jgi:hypothetical protein
MLPTEYNSNMLPALAVLAGICQLPLDGPPQPLLAGRLTIRLPAGAKRHEEAAGDATVAVVNASASFKHGSQSVLVWATEEFALASDDFEADVRKMYRQPATFETVAATVPGVRIVVVKSEAKGKGIHLELSYPTGPLFFAWVALPDRTVHEVSVSFNETGFNDPDCRARALHILSTIEPGRKLVTSPGVRHLGDLAIQVPDGYVTSFEGDRDQAVYHIRKLGLWKDGERYGLVVGVFMSSDLFARWFRDTAGEQLTKPIPWQAGRNGSRYKKIPPEPPAPDWWTVEFTGLRRTISLSIHAESSAAADELKRIAATLASAPR